MNQTKISPKEAEFLQKLYDSIRTARMNVLYYGDRAARISRWSLFIEINIAVFASGSGIAGWQLWGSSAGQKIWVAMTAFTSVLAILKPILSLSSRLEALLSLRQAWATIFHELDYLALQIRLSFSVGDDALRAFDAVMQKFVQTSANDEVSPNQKLLETARRQVLLELPADHFWMPESSRRQRKSGSS